MEDFIAALTGFGMEIGIRLFGESETQAHGLDEQALAEAIVRIAAGNAAAIVNTLRIGPVMDAVTFCQLTGIIAGGMVGLAGELTGSDVSITAENLPQADVICLSAFAGLTR
jgi:hypothetical protein